MHYPYQAEYDFSFHEPNANGQVSLSFRSRKSFLGTLIAGNFALAIGTIGNPDLHTLYQRDGRRE